MTFIELPAHMQNFLFIFILLLAALTIGLITFQLMWYSKTNYMLMSLIALTVLSLDLMSKLYVICYKDHINFQNSLFYRVEDNPVSLHILINGIIIGFLINGYVNMLELKRNLYSSNSIREGFSNLPTGVCFCDESGAVILSNSAMNNFIWEVLGIELVNIDDAWLLLRDIEKSQLEDEYEPQINSIKLFLDDNTVKDVKRKKIVIDKKTFTQIVVSDITSLYSLSNEAQANNLELSRLRNDLKTLSDNLVAINHEEEVIRHKIQIHNELGNTILNTRAILKNELLDRDIILNQADEWESISDKLIRMNGETPGDDTIKLQEILDTAQQIGCEIIVHNDLSSLNEHSFIVRQILREALINSIRHGEADQMDIYVENDDNSKLLIITNNGKLPEKIKETGGLKNLREGLLREGASLNISFDKIFTITVKFN